MSKRETSKVVMIGDRKFRVEKFDALTGSYIAFTLMQKLLPLGLEGKLGGGFKLPAGRDLMTREEFTHLQKDCLQVVYEILPAGARPIIDEAGHWGVNDIDRDTALVITLTIHALAFNIAGFFAGGGLQGLREAVQDIIPARMPTSTDLHTDR